MSKIKKVKLDKLVKYDRNEKIKLIESVIESNKKLDVLMDEMKKSIGFDIESPLGQFTCELLDKNIKVTSKLVGDGGDWISWYIYDNYCGEKGYEAGFKDRMKKIKTVDDLVNLIEDRG